MLPDPATAVTTSPGTRIRNTRRSLTTRSRWQRSVVSHSTGITLGLLTEKVSVDGNIGRDRGVEALYSLKVAPG